MYGLTDNIVAGPAGHTTAGPAGSFMAGPAGSITPAPAGHVTPGPAGHVTPGPSGHVTVYPATGSIPAVGAGYVPIDTSAARIPYAAPSGGMPPVSGGGGGAPIPGGSASATPQSASGGMVVVGGGGFGGSRYIGGGFIGGGGGPGAAGNPGAGPSQGSGGMVYMTYGGSGFAPMELRVGQAMSQGAPGVAPTPAAEGFTVSPGGHTPSIRAGSVPPVPSLRFHAPQNSHVANYPMDVHVHTSDTEPYQPYKAPYVWEPQHVSFGQAILASDTLRSWDYDTPHVIFPEERPSLVYQIEIAARPSMQVNEISNQTVNLDLAQPRSVTNEASFPETRNLTLDNSITRNVTQNFPENRENTVNLDFSQNGSTDNSVTNQRIAQNIIEAPARILNMVFTDAPQASPTTALVGGGIMARVA